MKKLILILAIGLVLLLSFFAYGIYRAAFKPNVKESFSLWIHRDTDFEEIVNVYGTHFEDVENFQVLAEWKGLDHHLKAGHYSIEAGMSANTVVNTLLSGRQKPIQLTINFAKDLASLSRLLGYELMPDSAEFYDYFNSRPFAEQYQLQNSEALGFFIPNTYEFYWTTSPEEFAARMQIERERFWAKRKAAVESHRLNQNEIITLASIVESETAKFDEMPKVAGLYLNRLDRNILLQSDPTVIYAWQKEHPKDDIKRVLFKHLEIESPYNTYKNAGLPPGPIRIVSPQAIDAVLNADDHPFIFMCADPKRPGYHAFATSLSEHNVNRRRYINWLKEQKRLASSTK